MNEDEARAAAREDERQYRDEVLPAIIASVVAELDAELVHLGLPEGCRLVYVPTPVP